MSQQAGNLTATAEPAVAPVLVEVRVHLVTPETRASVAPLRLVAWAVSQARAVRAELRAAQVSRALRGTRARVARRETRVRQVAPAPRVRRAAPGAPPRS